MIPEVKERALSLHHINTHLRISPIFSPPFGIT